MAEFPIVDAFLLCPEEGKAGKIAVCTNYLAPSIVRDEIPRQLRKDIAVMGSLIVNRDGAERMIINSLAHPTVEYIILFGQEPASFCPSTNLLLALMDGYRADQKNNVIKGGRGVAHHYPSVPERLLDSFRKRFKVLPLYQHHKSDDVMQRYLSWLEPRIPKDVFSLIRNIRSKKKIYYDSLRELLALLQETKPIGVHAVQLDQKDFQHLQPSVIELEDNEEITDTCFRVCARDDNIVVDLDVDDKGYSINGNNSWLLACSLFSFMKNNNRAMPVKHQLLLGAELSRAEMQLKLNVRVPSLVRPSCKGGNRVSIRLASNPSFIPDKEFYYRIGLRDSAMYVQSLAYDAGTPVFELRAKSLYPIIEKLSQEDRFQDYEQQFLHRVDIGIETGRAAIALREGYGYFQDFRGLFKINKTEFPLLYIEANLFLDAHQKIITSLYTRGLTAPHPDAHKGTMRSATILAVFRNAGKALAHFPEVYSSGSQTVQEMRKQYKEQLQSRENRGTYTYGSRTRAHFGYDQLDKSVEKLKQDKNKTVVIQRFDMLQDMTLTETEITDSEGRTRIRLEATKDPCLTHDIYFVENDRLYSFHTARAHNIVNAYPENIFGLYDAYDSYIANKLGIQIGDMFMLSRGNILLLTEEQKAKKLIAEPCKPAMEIDNNIGPVNLAGNFPSKGIGQYQIGLEEREEKPEHPCLEMLENYQGIDLIEKAATYLEKRGHMHNNPIVGAYNPRTGELGEKQRLIFFHCNERGGKLHAVAVFIDGSKEKMARDVELCNYIATRYKGIMNVPLGSLALFYVPIRENG
jgi:hypothetical protein